MISTSNSNWLDRLRSSRGFPTGDEPDLDRFLSSSSSSGSAPTPNDSATHSESTQSHPPIPNPSFHPPPTKEFNGILGDLFNMGGETSRKFPIKTSRKQQNPRFCKLNSNSNSNSEFFPGSSGHNKQQQQHSVVPPKWGLENVGSMQLYPCNKEIVSGRNKSGDDVITRVDEELKGGNRGDDNIISSKWGSGKMGITQHYPCNKEIVSSRNKSGIDVINRVDEELKGGNKGVDNIISPKWGLGKVDCTQLYPCNKEIVLSRDKNGNDVIYKGDEQLKGGNRGDDNRISLNWGSEKVGSMLPYLCNRENVSRDDKNGDDFIVRVDEELKGGGGGEKDELKGYTRSEVTIVDTSLKDWKCDKWVFRKNDEWKIKDKKSKSRGGSCSAGKKRKVLVSKLENDNSSKINDSNGNGNDNDPMKLKMIKKKLKREVKNLLMFQNKEKPQIDKEGEPCKEREDFLTKFSRKRFPCPRPPEKVRNEGSSVVLLKSIPSSNVNTTIKPIKTFHKKRTKQMKII